MRASCQINIIVYDSPAMEVPDDFGRLVAFLNQKAVLVPRGVQLGRQLEQSRVLRVRLQRRLVPSFGPQQHAQHRGLVVELHEGVEVVDRLVHGCEGGNQWATHTLRL